MAWHNSITDTNLSGDFMALPQYVNSVTNNWVANLILIGAFIIASMGIYASNKDLFEAWAIAGFLTGLVATLFWWAQFIGGGTLILTLVVSFAGFIGLWLSKKAD